MLRTERERVAAILLAAGSSERMGSDKIWADLCGQPLIAWPIQAFAATASIDALIVVVRSETLERMRHLLGGLGLSAAVVVGGARRQDSVCVGLEAAAAADWVVVHDGARPLVTPDLVQRGLDAAAATGAAVAAVPVVDTIKRVQAERVVETLDRGSLWEAQTPQVFRTSLLVAAHRTPPHPFPSPPGERGNTSGATDDAMLVEALGVPVRVYMGAYGNIKVTNEVDLRVAAVLLEAQNEVTASAPDGLRAGSRGKSR